MFKPTDESSDRIERSILKKLFAVIGVMSVLVLAVGIGIGILLSERRASANETNVANAPESMSASFSEVAKRVEPAVVNIDTKGKIPKAVEESVPQTGIPDDILEFYKRQMRRPSYGVGSGFIVDKSGYILTNHHVIEDTSRITVRLQGGEEYPARVIGSDEETDLAVLKIDAGRELPSVKLGDSNTAQVGDWVLAIGSPFGLAQTVTAGIISQTKRETPQSNSFQRFIQTDAAINRGNSGGPLVNMNGEVIGINSQIATATGSYNGIGFALPSNEAANVYSQILAVGKVRRGFLGLSSDSVKPEFAKVYGLPEAKGAIVTQVTKASPAERAGLQVNDIIIEIAGKTVDNSQDLITKIAANEPEKEIGITYLREVENRLERRTTTIRLADRQAENNRQRETAETAKPADKPVEKTAPVAPLGLILQEVTPQMASRFEGLKGVIVKSIDPAGIAAEIKTPEGRDAIREGDLIQRINRVTVTDVKTFNDIASKLKPGDAVVLHITNYSRRTTQPRIVQFTVQ